MRPLAVLRLAMVVWLASATLSSSFVWAQTQSDNIADNVLLPQLAQIIRAQHTRRQTTNPAAPVRFDEIKAQLKQAFQVHDYDGNAIIDAADLQQRTRVDKAKRRSQFLQSRLAYDLDGDGRITRAELAEALRPGAIAMDGGRPTTPEALAKRLDVMITNVMILDSNGDGVITINEIIAQFESTAAKNPITEFMELQQAKLMRLDRDGDKRVTLEEFEAGMQALFALIDRNSDGAVSPEELAAAASTPVTSRPTITLQGALPGSSVCSLPQVPASAKLAVVGVYEGKALSTVRLGQTDSQDTSVIDIAIEKGSEPLFVVVSSYRANIWRFTGAVDRVTRVIASSQQAPSLGGGMRTTEGIMGQRYGAPHVGVIGITRDRVHFAAHGCIAMFYEPAKSAAQIKAIADMVGRSPDVIAGLYGAASLQLPSAIWDRASAMPGAVKAPDHPQAIKVWREMLRFNPAGLIEIDPDTVVTAGEVKRYTVLPNQAGLAQLVAEGTLTLEPDSWGQMTFVIKRATQFPAALHGAHSVVFIVAKGVPMPTGDPGHSCVFSEETGKPIGPSSGHCAERVPRRLAALNTPSPANPAAKPQMMRICQDVKTAPVQICLVAAERQSAPEPFGTPQPMSIQFVDSRSGDQRTLLPEGSLVADISYAGRHGMILALAKSTNASVAKGLRLVQVTLDGKLHEIATPEIDEVYSVLPEGDAVSFYTRVGETFSQLQLNLVTQRLELAQPATREQADAIGHRHEPPIGRSRRLNNEQTFPGYGGKEISASCMGRHGCLRQFIENDTDGDGRLSPADRKRLAFSTFDGKRNKLLPYEVDEVLGEKMYLDGFEVFMRTGQTVSAVFFDHNTLTVVSERPATAGEVVNNRQR